MATTALRSAERMEQHPARPPRAGGAARCLWASALLLAAACGAAQAGGEFTAVPTVQPAGPPLLGLPGEGPRLVWEPHLEPFVNYSAMGETPRFILPIQAEPVPIPIPVPVERSYAGGYVNPAGRFERRPAPPSAALPAPSDPGPTREVIASGSAAIGPEGAGVARKAAVRQALRTALERVAGVYVSGRTVSDRFLAVRDRIYTQSDGFVVPAEVLDEQNDGSTVRVKVRALVSVRPLVNRLRELGLTHDWKVAVWIRDGEGTAAIGSSAVAERYVGEALMRAGFQVVRLAGETPTDADQVIEGLRGQNGTPSVDVLVMGTATVKLAARLPVTLGGRLVRIAPVYAGQVDARAVRIETGEVIASHAVQELISDRAEDAAASFAAEAAGQSAASAVLDDVLTLPAAQARQIRIEARGFSSRAHAQPLIDALPLLSGVCKIHRHEYANGTLTVDLEVDADGAERLGAELEKAPELSDLKPTVESETKTLIKVWVIPGGGS